VTDRLDNRLGWLVSMAFHVLLALFLFFSTVEIKPFELDFLTIAFSPTALTGKSSGAYQPEFGGKTPLVELPRRQTIDETSPLLRLPDSERKAVEAVSPADKPDLTKGKSTISDRRHMLRTPSTADRERAGFSPLPISDEELTGIRPDGLSDRIAGDEMFTITWEGNPRTKIRGKLPEFPPGLRKAATVRINFEVTPDGAVSFASPITKGLPELEKVSLEALRTWRFNPLDKAQKQVKQRGVVTFIFKLK